MTISPSPRMTAILRALFRRLRDGAATAIVATSSFFVFLSIFLFILFLMDCLLILVGAKETILPADIYLPVFACALACATCWIFLSRSPATPPILGSAQTSFLTRASMLCSRGPHIFESALQQFFNGAPHLPGDPRAPSLSQRYRNRLSDSGHGSIVAAIAVSLQAIPAFFIAIGLMALGIAGGIAAFLLGALANFLSGSPSSPLVSARCWASGMVDRLVAEGSSDLAASEAALLDQSLPASPTAAKSPRL